MKNAERDRLIKELAEKYNNPAYFIHDPVIFPKHFLQLFLKNQARLPDVEIAGIIASHLAWGRREMIVRDCNRAMDVMDWKPFEYVMSGCYKECNESLHRTIKWSDFARICSNLKSYYTQYDTLEEADTETIRTKIFGQKSDPRAANKKIHMFFRWMVRDDGIVDLGIWKKKNPSELIIPLDVHVHRSALELGITKRKSADFATAIEITEYLLKLFPDDPCKGDFALFAHAVSNVKINR